MLCPRCQTAIAEGARFCARCGTTLVPQAATPAERRQLTVLFCDLVDSTALSVRLDPEDLREVMRAYRKYVSDTVARFGGFVSQYTGDVVVVWGAKMAGEGSSGSGTGEVIAYEKKVPTEGGFVLLTSGTVKQMTADEFKAAPKAK